MIKMVRPHLNLFPCHSRFYRGEVEKQNETMKKAGGKRWLPAHRK